MSAIPEGALLGGDVFVFGDQALCAMRIEIPLYASGTRSDAYAIMRVRLDGAGGPGLYLYDILVP